jgi:type III pantothenate kinase
MQERFPYLVVDISNSRTKMSLATRDALVGEKITVPTADFSASALAGLPECGHAILCSVVPARNKVVADFFGERLLSVSHAIELGVAVDYPEPQTIGADRLANAAAVAALYGTPAVVIDFGTAVTFDIVSAERAYVGGVIAPGLEVMTDYMYQRTALLPMIDLLEPTAVIGKSTKSAMLSGAVHGYRGMIREILLEIRGELGTREEGFKVVATGGYAELIASKLPAIHHVNPQLTLDGLRIIGNLNFTS